MLGKDTLHQGHLHWRNFELSCFSLYQIYFIFDRGVILNQSSPTTGQNAEKQLIFTVQRNHILSTQVREILRNHQEDINKLLGVPTKLIVAERRNANTASLLFAKSSFSKELVTPKASQKCGSSTCMLCDEKLGIMSYLILSPCGKIIQDMR